MFVSPSDIYLDQLNVLCKLDDGDGLDVPAEPVVELAAPAEDAVELALPTTTWWRTLTVKALILLTPTDKALTCQLNPPGGG